MTFIFVNISAMPFITENDNQKSVFLAGIKDIISAMPFITENDNQKSVFLAGIKDICVQ